MTYNANIPQPTDLISVSQGQILANFQQLNTQFGIDHVAFNTGSGNGDGHHKQATFDASVTPSTPTGTQSVLYPQTVSGAVQLFFQNATTTTQITGVSSNAAGGYVFLPGGFIIQWNNVTATDNTTIAFPISFPTACRNVQITPLAFTNPGTLVSVSPTPTNSLFTPRVKKATDGSTASAIQIFYLAIGY